MNLFRYFALSLVLLGPSIIKLEKLLREQHTASKEFPIRGLDAIEQSIACRNTSSSSAAA